MAAFQKAQSNPKMMNIVQVQRARVMSWLSIVHMWMFGASKTSVATNFRTYLIYTHTDSLACAVI